MSDPLIISLALIAVPLGGGALLGSALCRLRGERYRSVFVAIAGILLPLGAAVVLAVRFPIIGFWDAGMEGLLFGIGLCCSAHRIFADERNILLAAGSTLAAALLLELCARLFLPPPPAFPIQHGPHLLLANALRGDLRHQPWDTLSKDLVCSIVYGEKYPGIFDSAHARREIVMPQTFAPRPEARRRVLHLGDSMAFGFGLPRDQTFTADLERLEPGVQHINAAIPGTAPDAYLATLQTWIETLRVDLVVMHIYSGNDLDGLDSRYPCCGWESLLVYDDQRAALRCPQGTPPALGQAGFRWLRYHTPPPYLVRALIGTSSAAAYVAAAMSLEPYFLIEQPLSTQAGHLEAILRSAGEMLTARRVGFAVHVLSPRNWLEDPDFPHHYAPAILAAARQAGVVAFDSSDVLRNAVKDGESLFFESGDIHFNANGHRLLAPWLHEVLGANESSAP
jgi:hypothetical protein